MTFDPELVGLGTALSRGLRGRCPRCGKGKMFRAFLKVADQCAVCGQELHHQRADDMPAYIVMVLVGHIFIPLVCLGELLYSPPYWLQLAFWLPTLALVCVGLLQPVKGCIVALQWRNGMHGFGHAGPNGEAVLLTSEF